MGTLSKLSKAFLLPIALLPIAGIFLGVGATISSKVDPASAAWYFGNFLNKMGDIAFGNLPVLFCISVAMAYTEDAGVAALTSVVGFLVFNAIQLSLLNEAYAHIQYVVNIEGGASPIMGLTVDGVTSANTTLLTGDELLAWMRTSDIYKELVKGNVTVTIVSSVRVTDQFNLLFYTGQTWAVQNKLLTSNLGINSLNTGVFGGIFVGAIAAFAYNRFHKTQLPSALIFLVEQN
nr:PTS transporter subunit EIIC [Spiroplasma citri]